jgi:hypothetical protein
MAAETTCDDEEHDKPQTLQALLERAAAIATMPLPPEPRVTRIEGSESVDGLYPFQVVARELISNLKERPLNILCNSPTGSGKSFLITCAARFALATDSSVIVAQPLIALAEQVYRNLLKATPERVALLTGPIKKGGDLSEANALVCTYEVVARMICGNSPALSAVSCLVIDEFHFMSNEDRGGVIAELLDWAHRRSLPVIALSGTLSNAPQVAAYLGRVNSLDTAVIGMQRRPIPLQWLFYDARDQKFVDLQTPQNATRLNERAIGGVAGRQDLLTLIRGLEALEFLPSLVVAFSCKTLDSWADWAASLELLDKKKRSLVQVAFRDMLRRIPEEEHDLFSKLKAQAERGVFLHHSHLPTQYLQLVSKLAEQRCCPLVFSASSLALGINLPVRSVVLTSATVPSRLSGDREVAMTSIDALLFNQIFGRAGRPGFETVGYGVIVGLGPEGYASAQALVQAPMPPVQPRVRISLGDVVRAACFHRSLALDRAVFERHDLRLIQLQAAEAAKVVDGALKLLRPMNSELLKSASELARAMRAVETCPSSLLRFAAQKGELVSYDRCALGRFQPGADPRGLVLSTPRGAPAKVPIEDFERVVSLRKHVKILLRPYREELIDLAAILAAEEIWSAPLRESPLNDVIEPLARQLRAASLLDDFGVPTALGRAAVHARSCSPIAAILVITNGPFPSELLVQIASALLGDGRQGQNYALEELLSPSLRFLDDLQIVYSSHALVRAALEWTSGAAVAEILARNDVLSAGEVCRHVVRVVDLLEELAQVAEALGADATWIGEMRAAGSGMRRGLPFAGMEAL